MTPTVNMDRQFGPAARGVVPCAVSLLVVGLWHAATIALGLGYYDEGLAVVGAERLLNGELPYRDFWTLYAPGNFAFIAAVFKLFGCQLLASRLASLVAFLGALACLFGIGKRMMRPWAAAALVMGVGISATMPWGAPTTLAMLPALACGLASLRWWDCRNFAWAFGAGLLAGLTGFVRHDFGGYIAASVLVFCLLEWSLDRATGAELSQFVVGWGCGLAVVVIPLAIAATALGIWPQVYADLIAFPAQVYPKVRAIAWPTLFDAIGAGNPRPNIIAAYWTNLAYPLPFLLAPILPALTLAAYAGKCLGPLLPADLQRRWSTIGCCAIAAAFFLLQARVRPDYGHIVPSLMFSLTAFAGMAASADGRWRRIAMAAPVWLIIVAAPATQRLEDLHACWMSPRRMPCGLPRAKGIIVDRERDVAVQAIHYVRSTTAAAVQPFIYVGNTRHDRILASSTLFYFLAERRCPNRHHEMHPGLTTTLPVQQEIVRSLDDRGIETIVLYDESAATQERNASAESSGVFELDDYVKSRFRKVKEFGCYHLWQRR